MKKVLILGGTGMLGAPVVRQMLADGFDVRLLARDPEKATAMFGDGPEVFAGDVTDLDGLERAMTGCHGVHISVGGSVDLISAENGAAFASKLELAHITYISGSTVREENSWFPMTAQKLKAETAVRQCGVPYTIFCPTWPLEQLPRFVRDGRATLVGDQPVLWHWFAADDLGRMVANAYQREAARGKRLYIHGPEPVTMKNALEHYCRTFHPEIESIMVMPVDMARSVADSTGNQMLKFFAELMDYFQKVGEPGDPTEANEILGAPAATLNDWIAARKRGMATAVD